MAGYLSSPSLLCISNPCLSQYVSPGDNTISQHRPGMNITCTYSSFRIVLDNSCCGAFRIIPARRWQVPRALNHCTMPGGNYTASVNLPNDFGELDHLPARLRWHTQPGDAPMFYDVRCSHASESPLWAQVASCFFFVFCFFMPHGWQPHCTVHARSHHKWTICIQNDHP